jgi:hypothetical protein
MFRAGVSFYTSLGLLGLSRPPLKIDGHIAFGLALQAGIAHRAQPFLRLAIVFKAAVLHRLMKALAYVVEHDPGLFVPCQGKTYTIGVTVSRHAAASASIANIAELAQFCFGWSDLIGSGAAGSGKSRAQRQTGRKWPTNGNSLGRKKEGTRHNSQC